MRKERKNEALLWFGKWTSKLGNIVFDYANSVNIVGAFSHAPWVLALYQSSETVIQIVFNLIGGAKADSGSRKKILIVTDVLSAAICLAVSFFVASPRMAEVVIAANALLAVVYAFNSPTYRSIVREMVDGERIGMYNSVSNGGGEVIKIAGPMAGMLLVRWIGVRGALLFDALTFLLSAVSEMLLMPISGAQKKPKEKKNIFRDIAEQKRALEFLVHRFDKDVDTFVTVFVAATRGHQESIR
ncbi:MAG: MFS transporter [Clostridiales bacterium]|nr:MFS transporter [Clostridiales bacterium]